MPKFPIQHIEILNRLGQAFSHCAAVKASYAEVVDQIGEILDLPAISMWLLGPRRQMLGREVFRHPPGSEIDPAWLALDEELALWQKENSQMLYLSSGDSPPKSLRSLSPPAGQELISVPILHREATLKGVLNVYSFGDVRLLDGKEDYESQMELFRALAGQLSIFAENRSLETSSLLLREIHHRVKNNLQTVASLLRMQLRRLDRLSPEQALQDSINRIHSIAVVHERLSQTDIGRVDFADLVGQLAGLLMSDIGGSTSVDVDTGDEPIMLDSGDATSAALVVNELIQNALQHGASADPANGIQVSVRCVDGLIDFQVQDRGAGLPADFSLERDSHLGLTIVSTLVADELKGEFGLEHNHGTRAWARFPAEPGSPA